MYKRKIDPTITIYVDIHWSFRSGGAEGYVRDVFRVGRALT